MYVRIYWIEGLKQGRLGIIPRPRGGEWLEDEIISLKSSGVDALACLLEKGELDELGLTEEETLCESNAITFLSFPIPDFGVPLSHQDTSEFINTLSDFLRKGGSVVIHCRQGIGRSSTIAACLLAANGFAVEEAFSMISRARGLRVPDTGEQREWAAAFAGRAK